MTRSEDQSDRPRHRPPVGVDRAPTACTPKPAGGADIESDRAGRTFTFNLHVTSEVGSGTSFHDNSHFNGSLDEATDPKVAFDKSHCK